ncbi:MAG TPA: CUB domain-containing protein [Chitinophagales bacterium]|nr:CUB domain-containing protein [Chitinophagales bacterium]
MRNTFTNFFLPLSNTEVPVNGQTYQSSARGPKISTLTHRQSKLKLLTIIVCALIMIEVSVKAQTHTMAAGNYALTGSVTYYDPGGVGGGACPSAVSGNYASNLNITETINANAGQRIVVTFTGGLFGLATGDFLRVYDGPTTASPLLATYTNTTNPIPNIIGASTSNSLTFLFTSDATNTCKGWQATVAAYYYMQPGSFTFSCPGTYTFLDPQQPNSGGPGGDASCMAAGSTKDYQDNILYPVETFTTSNGQCIQIDPTFPSNFGLCTNDTLKVYDGPNILSPIANSGAAIYTNTFTNPTIFSTLGSSATFQFYSDGGTHARGWQIAMSCVNCPSASINNDCVNAIQLSPTNSCNYLASSTSAGNSNNPFLAPCTGDATDDVWYKFVANNSTMSMTAAATDGTMNPVMQLLSGTCGSFTSLYCQNATGVGGTEIINATGLTVGNTYFLRVYDFTANAVSHTFNICVVGAAPTDCVGAVHLCSSNAYNGQFSWNAYGTQEWTSGSWGCILFGETTSQWQYWQCQTSGTMEFSISSSNGTFQDVDWALWQMNSFTCPMSGQPVRCSYAYGFASNGFGDPPYTTGCHIGATDTTETAGSCCGPSTEWAIVKEVNVVAGRYYVLMTNLFQGNLNYQLTFHLTNGATFNDCVLPIELLSFDGESLGAVNRIYWTTLSELNNDHFILEHSADAINFSELASVPAAGTTASPSSYNYYDQHPFNGINYYRLKQVDVDESYTYSSIISLEKYSDAEVVPTINPNPTSGIFNIGLVASENCKVEIEVFNGVGQRVQAMQVEMHPGENNFPVDLLAFERGIYTVKIRACDIGKVFTRKIVKI